MMGPDMKHDENGVLYFDRSTYTRTAHTKGQCTLDGRVWTGEGYEEETLW